MKILNSNNNNSCKPGFLVSWDIVVFRLIAHLQNMICLKLEFYTKSYVYTSFGLILISRGRNIR